MKKFLFAFLFGIIAVNAEAQEVKVEGFVQKKAAPNSYIVPTDPAVRKKLDQWQDLKFGVLFHWGIYAVPGIIESWSIMSGDVDWQYKTRMKMGMDYDTYKKWYFALADKFNPVNFNPEQWADVMQDAGIKYMLFTSKHHDGFAMFDSKYSDFGIAHGAFKDNPKKDVLRYVLQAFRDKGFMVGPYFSKPDWHYKYFWNPMFDTGQSMGPNYKPENHPDWWKKFKTYACNQMTEITQDYGPVDIVWLDGGLRMEDLGLDSVILQSRKKYPGMICVDRGQTGPWENYRTPEQNIPKEKLDYPWESCITLSTHHWSYHDPEDFKTPREVVNTLSEIVAKGGCLALGVGPSPDGVIDNRVVKILHQVGLWMRANGKAIYNTRATDTYNEGKTWFTADKNGKTLYAIYALADNDKLPVTITWKGNIPTGKMKLLSNNKTLKYKVSGEEVTVTLPKGMKDDSFALTFNKK